jgi:hypothetical protein
MEECQQPVGGQSVWRRRRDGQSIKRRVTRPSRSEQCQQQRGRRSRQLSAPGGRRCRLLLKSRRARSTGFFLNALLHLKDNLSQFSQFEDLRIGGDVLGLARHHRGGRQKGDNVDWFWHPKILRRASCCRRLGSHRLRYHRSGRAASTLGGAVCVGSRFVIVLIAAARKSTVRTGRHGLYSFFWASPGVTVACAVTSGRSSCLATLMLPGGLRRSRSMLRRTTKRNARLSLQGHACANVLNFLIDRLQGFSMSDAARLRHIHWPARHVGGVSAASLRE